VEVSLCTQTLGRVQLPVRIRIPGSRGRPLEFVIDARSMGPDLLLGPEGAPVEALLPTAAINYGNVPVLLQHKHHLQVCCACSLSACLLSRPDLVHLVAGNGPTRTSMYEGLTQHGLTLDVDPPCRSITRA
jgi:hypothetical protein